MFSGGELNHLNGAIRGLFYAAIVGAASVAAWVIYLAYLLVRWLVS